MMEANFELFRHATHYSFHFIAPFLFARLAWKKVWIKEGLILVSAIIIDLDHLVANPIFDSNRCSIGFHPLHSGWAGALYLCLLLAPKRGARVFGLGCLWHLFTDFSDCLLNGIWPL